jgi:hypothetical protein
LYQRQRGIFNDFPAAVVGVGGSGSWVALMLALSGAQQLTLMDPDRVEPSNLNRLPLPTSSVGRYKVEAMAEEIARYRPECKVVAIPERFTDETKMLITDYVIFDCTDRAAIQKMIYEHAKKQGFTYVRAGCDKDNMTSVMNMAPWVVGETPGGYDNAIPMWVGPAAIVAAYSIGVIGVSWPAYTGRIARTQ